MRFPIILISALALVLVGCGKKDDTTAPGTTPPAKSAAASTTGGGHEADAGMKDKLVGDWTMNTTQGTTTIEGNLSVLADGTYTQDGMMNAESPNEAGTMKVGMTYHVGGKWTLDGNNLATTPDPAATKVKMDHVEITAKDPANQSAIDAQKGELAKKAEEQITTGLNTASTSKVDSVTAEAMTVEGPGGVKLEYKKKA